MRALGRQEGSPRRRRGWCGAGRRLRGLTPSSSLRTSQGLPGVLRESLGDPSRVPRKILRDSLGSPHAPPRILFPTPQGLPVLYPPPPGYARPKTPKFLRGGMSLSEAYFQDASRTPRDPSKRPPMSQGPQTELTEQTELTQSFQPETTSRTTGPTHDHPKCDGRAVIAKQGSISKA